MVYTSTQALQNSLPNRAPSQRPRSLSLSEYQPLSFDREATALAYQNQLRQPPSSSTSTFGVTSSASGSVLEADQAPSSLSHHLRRGDNPHSPRRDATSPVDVGPGGGPFFGASNFAGVGAGHSLTPPQSPIHQAAQEAHRTSLNLSAGMSGSSLEDGYIAPGSGLQEAPELPKRPSMIPESTYPAQNGYGDGKQKQRQRSGSGSGIQRTRPPSWLSNSQAGEGQNEVYGSGMGTVGVGAGQPEGRRDGYESDPGYPRYVGGSEGGRRMLPAVPTNVPAPEPPGWEPDYKPQIPAQLTQSSVEHAYAQLSAPPPGLPPRRQPQRQYGVASSSTNPNGNSSTSEYTDTPLSGSSQPYSAETPLGNSAHPGQAFVAPAGPPPGAPSFPFQIPTSTASTTFKPRRPAEESVVLKADGRTPIWSTHFLDPCLRNPLINIPQQVANMTNKAVSNLAAKDAATAAQVDGMARLAKGWFVPPDGKFATDKGAIELGLGVIDCGGREGEEGWGRDKGRRRARVEVFSRTGGIKLDLIELDENRQVDLKVDTKAGDVMILLPHNFLGGINITTPGPDPHFCRSISTAISPISHPYETVYSTSIAPLSTNVVPTPAPNAIPGRNPSKQRWIPEFLRPQDDTAGGHAGGEGSKITITTQGSKSRVVLGYRDCADEEEAKGMGVMVGMQGQEKKKRWWR